MEQYRAAEMTASHVIDLNVKIAFSKDKSSLITLAQWQMSLRYTVNILQSDVFLTLLTVSHAHFFEHTILALCRLLALSSTVYFYTLVIN